MKKFLEELMLDLAPSEVLGLHEEDYVTLSESEMDIVKDTLNWYTQS